jgi:hypothetical protein
MHYLDKTVDSLGLARFNSIKPLQQVAGALKVRTEYLTLVVAALSILIMVLTTTGQYALMVLVVYLYPVYKTFKAREGNNPEEHHRWLVYWTVFGFIVSLTTILSLFIRIPSMPLLLSVLCFAVYAALVDGQAYIYDGVMQPILKKYESTIDKYVQMAKDEATDAVKRAKREVANKLVQ